MHNKFAMVIVLRVELEKRLMCKKKAKKTKTKVEIEQWQGENICVLYGKKKKEDGLISKQN